MNSFFISTLAILLQGTALLALGWIVHALLRKRHPQWRLILWRSLLCLGLMVPLAPLAPVPALQIPVLKPSSSL